MKRGGKPPAAMHGFTIVETLIVLAVTSVLFVSTALLIDGKQRKTEFMTGARGIQQSIQQVINETISGYYPSNNLQCSAPGGSSNVSISPGSSEQGSNQACIFAGKVLVVGGSTHQNDYVVYPVAGRRLGDDAYSDSITPKEARITAIAPSSANPNAPDLSSTQKLPAGLTYAKARLGGGAWTSDVLPVAFLSSLSGFSGGAVGSGGAQQIDLRRFNIAWSSGAPEADAIDNEVNPLNADPYPIATQGVEYCFSSGGTDESALIGISSGLEVSLSIKSGAGC